MFIKRKDYEAIIAENAALREIKDRQTKRIEELADSNILLRNQVENLKKWKRKADPKTGKFVKQQ
jgi:GTPase Era involved in 16S rRNA processing